MSTHHPRADRPDLEAAGPDRRPAFLPTRLSADVKHACDRFLASRGLTSQTPFNRPGRPKSISVTE